MDRPDRRRSSSPEAALAELERRVAGAGSAPLAPATDAVAPGSGGDDLSISATYFTLRRGLGVISLLFPFVLVVFGGLRHVQPSLSAYYHFSPLHPETYGAGRVRNVFVGVLCATGVFLILYKGYSRREDVALDIAGVASVVIALAPVNWLCLHPLASGCAVPSPQIAVWRERLDVVHHASAVVFFVAIAFVCLFCGGETLGLLRDERVRRRFRAVYLMFGVWLVASLALIAGLRWGLGAIAGYWLILLETSEVVIFALFWLVKSREIALIEDQGR